MKFDLWETIRNGRRLWLTIGVLFTFGPMVIMYFKYGESSAAWPVFFMGWLSALGYHIINTVAHDRRR